MVMDVNNNTRKSLEDAYKTTRYEVFLDGSIVVIRIGKVCNALDDLCNEYRVSSWAFITAHNPFSQPLTDDENRHRQKLLESLLIAANFKYFAGQGIGESGDWPPEASFLVLGMDQKKALAYGRVFDQNAIVFGNCGDVAQLLYCVSDRD